MLVNRRQVAIADPSERLLDYLRDDLDLKGVKEGCGMGECGACTVLVAGEPVCSCLVLVGQVAEAEIVTPEGLGESGFEAVRESFVRSHATQCGFCIPGMVVSVAALLSRRPEADEDAMREALAGNLCRCTGYGRIFEAVRDARQEMLP